MSSPVAVIVIAAAAVLAGVLGWVLGPRFVRRAAAHRFAREFASLVEGTELDLAALRGPSHDSLAATAAASTTTTTAYAAAAESTGDAATGDVATLSPKPLSLEDQDYYAASWQNVQGEFAVNAPSALLGHPSDGEPAAQPRPAARRHRAAHRVARGRTFPSALGYRDALRVSTRTDHETVPEAELTRALAQFQDFYFEMLTLAAAIG